MSPKWIEATRKILDKNLFSEKMMLSLKEVGDTLAGVPQLGMTSLVSSSITALAISKIASGQNIQSGRYLIDLNFPYFKGVL